MLKEKRCSSLSAVDDIATATQDLFKYSVSRIQAGVSECLAKQGINSTEISELNEIYESVKDSFQGLNSTYLQEKFYREKLGCIVSP